MEVKQADTGSYAVRVSSNDGTAMMIVNNPGNLGIGMTGPNAKLQVVGGDAAVTTQWNGVILRATDGGNCCRVTVNDAETLSTATVACP